MYVMRFPAEASDAEVSGFARAREAWAEHCAHTHAWVADLGRLRWVSALQRQLFASHLGRMRDCDVRWNAGSGLVIPSTMARGFVSAIFWITPPECPHETFGDEESALAWCSARLAAGGGRSSTG